METPFEIIKQTRLSKRLPLVGFQNLDDNDQNLDDQDVIDDSNDTNQQPVQKKSRPVATVTAVGGRRTFLRPLIFGN